MATSLSFLIPLAIALGAIYVRSHTQEEIVRILAAIVAAIGFGWSFALAPGILQILVLAVGLWVVWCCCRQSCADPRSSG